MGTKNQVLVQALLHCSVTMSETLGLRLPFTEGRGRCPSGIVEVPRPDGASPLPQINLAPKAEAPGVRMLGP